MSEFRELLRRSIGEVPFTEEQLGQLERHYDLLRHWNQKLNLTALRSEEESVRRNYGESVLFADHLRQMFSGALRVADVGTGAGFPGFVLAVMQPAWSVTLIESHQRKAVFLREVSRGVGRVRVLAQRAEQVTEAFDLVTSRAVRPQDVLRLIPRLAPCVALLLSKAQADSLTPANEWQAEQLGETAAYAAVRST